MNLTPREKDKLLVAMAAIVARRRLERGLALNFPEAVAIITDFIMEGARDGQSVAALMRDGAAVLTTEQVMEGIPEMIFEIQVEATFPDGTKLVTVHEPIRPPVPARKAAAKRAAPKAKAAVKAKPAAKKAAPKKVAVNTPAAKAKVAPTRAASKTAAPKKAAAKKPAAKKAATTKAAVKKPPARAKAGKPATKPRSKGARR